LTVHCHFSVSFLALKRSIYRDCARIGPDGSNPRPIR
jgi:hypothetical protein